MSDRKPETEVSRSIAIVSHCYAETLPQYAIHLRHQIESLIHWAPTVSTTLYVIHTTTDANTGVVLQDYAEREMPATVQVLEVPLPKERLFRRAIGRNFVAKNTRADVVWFTDVDYFFGEGCLDAAAAATHRDDGLTAPRTVLICRDHETGDRMTSRVARGEAVEFPIEAFAARKQGPVIGGIQMLGGNTARRIGYLDGTRWMNPVDEAQGFRSCRCDTRFRRYAKRMTEQPAAKRIDVPNLYRIRHSENGRDYDASGMNKGTSVW